jgi:hypothetical protein
MLELLFVGYAFPYSMPQLSSLAFYYCNDYFQYIHCKPHLSLSLGPTLTGILPYAGLKFYTYEKLKMHVPEEHQKSILMRLSCGALAGLFGQTLTYPLDVVKRQMQVGSLQNAANGDARYRNTFDGLRKIVRNQGWKQLFAGVSINYIRVMLNLSFI